MKTRLLAFLFCSFPLGLLAQSSYAPLNEDYYHSIDRYEVKSGRISPTIFTGVKPYKRSDIVAFVDTLHANGQFTSRADEFTYEYLRNDSWEWSRAETSDSRKPILKALYKKKSDMFKVDEDAFDLHINPVLYVGAGNDSHRDDMLFINTRGVEVRGMVDKKVGFYTYLTDNQAVLPSYVWEQMATNPVIPHEGFWKEFKKGKGVDFLQARGYITFEATRHINVQFGHDRVFVGNGYRSLIFSDFSPPTWFLKGTVKVWKLNYMFLLNQMTADVDGALSGLKATNGGYPTKFNAMHHLSINVGKKLNLGVFESVMFSVDDSTGTDNFRLDYLNPIIFYRAIEQQNGSSDNVLLGFDFKWNAVRKLSFYGQFVLDEFVLSHIKAGDGWWANKFAIQGGAKYIDAFGVPNLDLQGEVNIVRPYTYSHNTNYANYSSYRQPIAHPLGANFNEVVGVLRYQPLRRLNLVGKLIVSRIGRDTTGVNWGSDVLKNNTTRQQELGNTIGQGIANDIVFGTFTATWMLKHNLFIDANLIVRKSKSDLARYNNDTTIGSLALRWNLPRRLYEF
ncbi:hypothetical protein [Chryseolinea lacunae]|uniref:Capsule assembly Wzi family protein n=1 Tax=Chryseolinea lacunae TaxID=2801331 RepID=A0ABS1KL78_9BACT|nr:hypothetical protein [Chryseolinea lacunae]MBL0740214.1 hypothetical protein [Chryseolinea lacunae]